jgi:hypothetical protein
MSQPPVPLSNDSNTELTKRQNNGLPASRHAGYFAPRLQLVHVDHAARRRPPRGPYDSEIEPSIAMTVSRQHLSQRRLEHVSRSPNSGRTERAEPVQGILARFPRLLSLTRSGGYNQFILGNLCRLPQPCARRQRSHTNPRPSHDPNVAFVVHSAVAATSTPPTPSPCATAGFTAAKRVATVGDAW